MKKIWPDTLHLLRKHIFEAFTLANVYNYVLCARANKAIFCWLDIICPNILCLKILTFNELNLISGNTVQVFGLFFCLFSKEKFFS